MIFSKNSAPKQIIDSMKIFATTFFLSFILAVFSQKDQGFYGHKAIVQLEGLASYPFFSNVITNAITGEPSYRVSGGKLVESKDRFNYGFRGTLGYAIKRNIAILFEVGQDYSNAGPESNSIIDISGLSQVISKHEILNVVTTSFIPKIEFATSKSLLPMGIGHQIGFGIANSKVIEKNYSYEIQSYDSFTGKYGYTPHKYGDSNSDVDPINFEKLTSIKKYVLMYALSVRTPLSKNILLNYGVRYTLNFGKNSGISTNSGNDQYTSSTLQTISRHRLGSIINANIGICFTF
jgi:hypothetical protein